jgi:hypothetical protein|tara:strand:+ start:1336 stop:2637 length:1302 start_codon:yes stop_codon:yes gene_type:complete
MKAGSFFPGRHYSSLYAMAGDDCSLHFDLNNLTEKQQADHLSNVELTAMLQVALACIGHKKDHLALYDTYETEEWQNCLRRYHNLFTRMVEETVPMDHFSYHPKFIFYESVAALIDQQPDLVDAANLYMSSGSNSVIHKSPELLAINQNVNSKKHFAEHAPAFGIPFPDTLTTTKVELDGHEVSDFFARHQNQIIVKLLGLAGARNVAPVNSIEECQTMVAEYQDDMVVLLQARLPLDFYTEMTVDLIVSDTDISIANTRKILFAEGLWVGNLIGDSVQLTEAQEAALLNVGQYARQHGYSSELGSNCGIDFFVGKDESLIVTEINARWTGGLFPAEVLSQIDTGGQDAVAFFDIVPSEQRDNYVDFLDQHLIGEFKGDFAMVPLGIGCFDVPMEDGVFHYIWQAVLGDFEAFKETKKRLGAGVMPTADMIKI